MNYPQKLSPMAADVKSVLTKRNIEIVDMADIFNGIPSPAGQKDNYPFVIPQDGHFNELGHRLIASALKEKILFIEKLKK